MSKPSRCHECGHPGRARRVVKTWTSTSINNRPVAPFTAGKKHCICKCHGGQS